MTQTLASYIGTEYLVDTNPWSRLIRLLEFNGLKPPSEAKPSALSTACYCSDYASSGMPCPPGTCPNVPKPPAALKPATSDAPREILVGSTWQGKATLVERLVTCADPIATAANGARCDWSEQTFRASNTWLSDPAPDPRDARIAELTELLTEAQHAHAKQFQKAGIYGEMAYKWRKRCIDGGLAKADERIEATEYQGLRDRVAELEAQLAKATPSLPPSPTRTQEAIAEQYAAGADTEQLALIYRVPRQAVSRAIRQTLSYLLAERAKVEGGR